MSTEAPETPEAPAVDWTVTEPSRYDNMPAEIYHGDPVPGGSLSSTGARALLAPGCPAKYHYERENPRPSTATFDTGKAAHRHVLSAGEDIEVIDHPDWRTNDAKAKRIQAYADGKIPVLDKDMGVVEDMAAAIRAHDLAAALLDPKHGTPEVSLFAPWPVPVQIDGEIKAVQIWRRARLDFMPEMGDGSGRFIVPEYKTCDSADPEKLQRAFADYWYPMQARWNLDLVEALGIAHDPLMVFVCQERKPPYLVTLAQPDALAMRAARIRNAEAMQTYARCQETGRWPGYSDDVVALPLPAWIERDYV